MENSYLSSNSPKNTKLGIERILSHTIFSRLSHMQFSHLSIHEYLGKPEKLRENSGKMGYTT